jgi:hypothetical protein
MSSTTITASNNRSLLERFGSAWTAFWFTPSDPICLSALRIGVGLIALWWYWGFFANLNDWFGTGGLFPPEMLQNSRDSDGTYAWSILELASTPEVLKLIYGLGFVALLGMIAGIFTRVFTIASLIFVLSFVQASRAMARPVDDILAMLMFYLCIAPSGACFSLDACWRARREGSAGLAEMSPSGQLYTTATLATRMLQVHLAIIYATMAIRQLQFEAWWQGSAVWWMMARSESRLVDFTPLSRMGIAFVYIVNFLTHFIVVYEIAFATLIWNRAVRPFLLVLGVFVWLGIMLVNGSPTFCLLMLLANLAFVPTETLRRWCANCPRAANRSAVAV